MVVFRRYHFKHVACRGLHASPVLIVLVHNLLLLGSEVLSSATSCSEATQLTRTAFYHLLTEKTLLLNMLITPASYRPKPTFSRVSMSAPACDAFSIKATNHFNTYPACCYYSFEPLQRRRIQIQKTLNKEQFLIVNYHHFPLKKKENDNKKMSAQNFTKSYFKG